MYVKLGSLFYLHTICIKQAPISLVVMTWKEAIEEFKYYLTLERSLSPFSISANWDSPFNELTFRIHRDTKTIYMPEFRFEIE